MMRQMLFKRLLVGVPNTFKMDYELDHLITASLGGADNIQNLWSEPYSAT
jgi:hypothetical protein